MTLLTVGDIEEIIALYLPMCKTLQLTCGCNYCKAQRRISERTDCCLYNRYKGILKGLI